MTAARVATATPVATSLPAHQLTRLDSGLRIVTEHMPSVRSAALGLFVDTGSRGETVEEAGLSHFLEHMLFRGTERFGSSEIDELFDGMGAELNAGTDKETTTVYARMLDQTTSRAPSRSWPTWSGAPSSATSTRSAQVVLEEIAMYEDEPQESRSSTCSARPSSATIRWAAGSSAGHP